MRFHVKHGRGWLLHHWVARCGVDTRQRRVASRAPDRLALIANLGMRRRGSEAVTGPAFAESAAYPGYGRRRSSGIPCLPTGARRGMSSSWPRTARTQESRLPSGRPSCLAVLPACGATRRVSSETAHEGCSQEKWRLPSRCHGSPAVDDPGSCRAERRQGRGGMSGLLSQKSGAWTMPAARDGADERGPVGASVWRSRPSSSRRCGCGMVYQSARSSARGRPPCSTGLAARAPRPSLEAAGDKLGDRCGASPITRSVCSADCPRDRRTRTWSAGLSPRSWSQYASRGGRPPHAWYTSTGTQAAWDCVLPLVRSAFHVKPTLTIAVGKAGQSASASASTARFTRVEKAAR